MQYSLASERVTSPQTQCKPSLISHDSGEEFSLGALARSVRRLVELVEEDGRRIEGHVFDDSLFSSPNSWGGLR